MAKDDLVVQKFKKDIKDEHYVESYSICVNPEDNGGEAVIVQVDVFDNGDDERNIYNNLRIQTHCYGTSQAEIMCTVLLDRFLEAIALLNSSVAPNRK